MMKPFSYSTAGKPAEMRDTLEEEATYASLATASNNCFTVDDVRLIRRMFDRADQDNNGLVDRKELELLLSTLDDASRKLIDAVLTDESAEQSWSFPAFVHWTRVKLSSNDRLKLMTQEIEYIRSMGIDKAEEVAQKEFNSHREERKKSLANLHEHAAASDHQLSSSSNAQRRQSRTYANSSVPNDVEAYKTEFGLE